MSEFNLNRVEAMLAHLKARGITVAVSGSRFWLQAAAWGEVHDNDIAALRGLLQALGLGTESVPESIHPNPANAASAVTPPASLAPLFLLEDNLFVPALVDPGAATKGNTLSLPLVSRDAEVLRHKAGAWFSTVLGVGATLFALLLSRYQQKEDWLRELGVAIAQQPGPGEPARAWFAMAPLIRHLPADGSLRDAVGVVAGQLVGAAVAAGETLDLALALPDSHDEDQLVWHFAADLFDEAFIRQLHADFVAILRQATALLTPMLSAITLAPPVAAPASPPAALPVASASPVPPRGTDDIRTPERRRYPLSPQQWAFVLDEQKYGPGTRHGVTAACFMPASGMPRGAGVVDLERAQKALTRLIQRHALLRTTFDWDSTPPAPGQGPGGQPGVAAQFVSQTPVLPWRALAVSATGDLPQAARQWLHEATASPLALFGELPWQASVTTLSNGLESASVWRLTLHNALADQPTADMFMAEWQALYAGETLPQAHGDPYGSSAYEDVPYGEGFYDHALRKEGAVKQESYGEYTQRLLAGYGPALQLNPQSDAWMFWQDHLDSVRPVRWPLLSMTQGLGTPSEAVGDPFPPASDALTFTLDAELMQKLRVAALAWQVSLDSLLLTAFAALLRRYVGEDRFVVGVEFANRPPAQGIAVAGVMSNVLPFVARLDEGRPGVRHRVEQTHGQLADLALYQSTPLISLLPLLARHRQGSDQPPIPFAFSCQSELNDAALQWVRRSLQPLHAPRRQSRVPIGLSLRCSELQASEGELEYYSRWLSPGAAAEFVDQYCHLLGAMVNDAAAALNQLPLMSLTRQQEMFDLFNREAQSLPSFLPHFMMWWQRQCYSAPQNLAVVAAEGRLSFAELDTLANQVARYLVSQGIGPGDRVGLLLPRDPVLLATLLAVFKVGAAWVPLHPHWPLAYQETVLAQAGVSCVLHDSERMPWQGALRALDFSIAATPWQALEGGPFEDADDPAALACILYPASVTPTPQGVTVHHRNLSALVAWGVRQFENRPPLRAAFTSELCAESALFELFVTLCSGGALILMDDLMSPLARERPTSSAAKLLSVVNHVTVTPTLAGELLRAGWLPKSLRTLALIGEPVPAALREGLLAVPGVSDLLELHACRENCGVAFVASVGEHAKPAPWRDGQGMGVIVGTPIDGTQCVILSAQGQLQPWGIAGDLCIGGAALSSGYWPAGEPSSSRFIKNPLTYFPTLGNTLFHTGYRACWHADGRIELLAAAGGQAGLDDTVCHSLRVEHSMQTALGGTAVALCQVKSPITGGDVRVAFVEGELPARHYLQMLQRYLPSTLHPDAVTVLQHWPRDQADRLDRRALVATPVEGRTMSGEAAPNMLELQMLRLWQEILGDRAVSIDTHFFAAGGHSLLAVQLAVQLAQRYALQRVPAFTTLMQYPTPRRLARWLDAALRGEESRATLWEPLTARMADRSVLVFQSPGEGANGLAWVALADALPEAFATYRVSARLREDDDLATLVQRYVDAIEQESLPLPAALAGEGVGALLAVAVAGEMHARGWPWLPVALFDSAAPRQLAPVRSRALHVNSASVGVDGRRGWSAILQGEIRWRCVAASLQTESSLLAHWLREFLGASEA